MPRASKSKNPWNREWPRCNPFPRLMKCPSGGSRARDPSVKSGKPVPRFMFWERWQRCFLFLWPSLCRAPGTGAGLVLFAGLSACQWKCEAAKSLVSELMAVSNTRRDTDPQVFGWFPLSPSRQAQEAPTHRHANKRVTPKLTRSPSSALSHPFLGEGFLLK